MLTLQRFTYDVEKQRKTKILDKVDMLFDFHLKDVFPDLNIPNTLDYEYELYAFIVHLVNILCILKNNINLKG